MFYVEEMSFDFRGPYLCNYLVSDILLDYQPFNIFKKKIKKLPLT